MTELALAKLDKELGFLPATAKGWTWTWQRCGRYEYRKCLTCRFRSKSEQVIPVEK